MLMKKIGKMKQKKGAVLFAVIAVMTLLIAMASTAYYTARSAYNSVISNYDYSQLYLSAISVSDMVVEAMASEPAKSAAGEGSNFFDPLREAVFGKSVPLTGSPAVETGLKSTTPGTAGHKVVVKSSGISDASAGFGGGARNDKAIMDELSTKDSIIAGVLDGVVIEVELNGKDAVIEKCKIEDVDDNGDGTIDRFDTTDVFEYTYTFRTVAYYRNNYITVEDIVTLEKTFKNEYGPGTPGYEKLIPLTKKYTTGGGTNLTNLNTFFTSTGQYLEDGELKTDNRTVLICSNEITDDAYFQNDATFFLDGSENVFKGGISSLGSVYIDKMGTEMDNDDNDWFIGKDLVFSQNANHIDLNGNNLYVGGNLVLTGSGRTVKAEDIYVEGNLYISGDGSTSIEGNLHVKGQIIRVDGTDTKYKEIAAKYNAETGKILPAESYESAFSVTGEQSVGADAYDGGIDTITLTERVANGDKYESVTIKNEDGTDKLFTVSDAIKTKTGNVDPTTGKNSAFIEYDNYTGKTDTYSKTVSVNFNDFALYAEGKDTDGDEAIDTYEYTSPDGVKYTSTSNDLGNCKNITVDLPYIEKGYVLDLQNADKLNPNGFVNYNIETGDKALPIVLKENTTTSDGKKAFAWKGDGHSNAKGALVSAVGDGNIVFEMANYDESGNIGAYNEATTKDVVVYKAGNNDLVGNTEQVNHISSDGTKRTSDVKGDMLSLLKGMVDENSVPITEYQNQIMLVSNANNGVAYDAQNIDNLFCGYVYAPNGDFFNAKRNDDGSISSNGGSNPVFGGMIVSQYFTHEAALFYADPNPKRISAMMSSLYSKNGSADTDSKEFLEEWYETENVPEISSSNADSITNADSANLVGSNYVG